MLAETYVRVEGAFPLIGVGGIDSGAAALGKIRAGADLVQLYSALVYRGLALVGEIKAALSGALDRGDADKLVRSGRRRCRGDDRGAVAGLATAPSARAPSRRISQIGITITAPSRK